MFLPFLILSVASDPTKTVEPEEDPGYKVIVTKDKVLPPKGYSSATYVFVVIVFVVLILSFVVAIIFSVIDGKKYKEGEKGFEEAEEQSAGVEEQEQDATNL